MLDRNLTAKVGDVGLARLLAAATGSGAAASPGGGGGRPPGQPSISGRDSKLVGTISFMDPEYLRTGQFSTKSDVYALGMVMLQLLTGVQSPSVVSQAEAAVQDPGRLQALVDKAAGAWPPQQVKAFCELALKCVEVRRMDRPDLRTQVLPGLLQLKQQAGLMPRPGAGGAAAFRPTPLGASAPDDGAGGDGDDSTPPSMFMCPITQDVMDDPVFAADGFTYERVAIAAWLAKSVMSPMTGLALEHPHLVPNRALKSSIQEWLGKQPGR